MDLYPGKRLARVLGNDRAPNVDQPTHRKLQHGCCSSGEVDKSGQLRPHGQLVVENHFNHAKAAFGDNGDHKSAFLVGRDFGAPFRRERRALLLRRPPRFLRGENEPRSKGPFGLLGHHATLDSADWVQVNGSLSSLAGLDRELLGLHTVGFRSDLDAEQAIASHGGQTHASLGVGSGCDKRLRPIRDPSEGPACKIVDRFDKHSRRWLAGGIEHDQRRVGRGD